MTPRVLGLDLSLTASAVASSAGWVEVRGQDGHRDDSYPQRMGRIHHVASLVFGLIGISQDLVLIEGPAYSRGADPSSFDRAFLWWLVYRYCSRHEIPTAVIGPTQRLVYALGKGQGSKGAVIDAVARRWPAYATQGDDNAADAVTLLAMGLDFLGQPLTPMPATHRRALDRVTWPDIKETTDA